VSLLLERSVSRKLRGGAQGKNNWKQNWDRYEHRKSKGKNQPFRYLRSTRVPSAPPCPYCALTGAVQYGLMPWPPASSRTVSDLRRTNNAYIGQALLVLLGESKATVPPLFFFLWYTRKKGGNPGNKLNTLPGHHDFLLQVRRPEPSTLIY